MNSNMELKTEQRHYKVNRAANIYSKGLIGKEKIIQCLKQILGWAGQLGQSMSTNTTPYTAN